MLPSSYGLRVGQATEQWKTLSHGICSYAWSKHTGMSCNNTSKQQESKCSNDAYSTSKGSLCSVLLSLLNRQTSMWDPTDWHKQQSNDSSWSTDQFVRNTFSNVGIPMDLGHSPQVKGYATAIKLQSTMVATCITLVHRYENENHANCSFTKSPAGFTPLNRKQEEQMFKQSILPRLTGLLWSHLS